MLILVDICHLQEYEPIYLANYQARTSGERLNQGKGMCLLLLSSSRLLVHAASLCLLLLPICCKAGISNNDSVKVKVLVGIVNHNWHYSINQTTCDLIFSDF